MKIISKKVGVGNHWLTREINGNLLLNNWITSFIKGLLKKHNFYTSEIFINTYPNSINIKWGLFPAKLKKSILKRRRRWLPIQKRILLKKRRIRIRKLMLNRILIIIKHVLEYKLNKNIYLSYRVIPSIYSNGVVLSDILSKRVNTFRFKRRIKKLIKKLNKLNK